MATFMQVLDTTIANVSIPTISGYLGVSTDQGTWIITSFAVANGVSVPLTGWLMRRFGLVRTFSLSMLLFTIASFLCGVSQSMTELILFRVLQGAVSGPMIPGSQALLLTLFPERGKARRSRSGRRPRWWRRSADRSSADTSRITMPGGWIFLINMPVGLICSLVSGAS